MARVSGWIVAAGMALGLATACASAQAPVRQECHAVTRQTCTIAHALGSGINLGNMLEAPREGDWGPKLEPKFIDLAAGNFTTVRLPVRWSNHAAPTEDATIREDFARRVDWAVDALLARGAYVILNLHHYSQVMGNKPHRHEFMVHPSVVDVRMVNLWRQIAQRYQDRSPRLIFELLNEPHNKLDGEPWNDLAARTLAAVRESNPTRAVLIGPTNYNNVRDLPKLRLPPDRNLIVAVHSYEPFDFTHQGVTWRPNPLPAGKPCCDDAQQRQIVDTLEAAAQWNRRHGFPVHLGEFGAYRAADLASRANYVRLVREEAERRGIGWAYWEFGSDFSGVYDPETRTWVEPLRRALLDR